MEKTINVELGGRKIPAIDLSGMTPGEWDTYRKSSLRIGGSDIGTILGLSRYSDAITLFCEKTGFLESSFSPSEATEGGHFDESAILKRLEYWDGMQWAGNVRAGKTFRMIEKPEVTFLPESHPYLALNVDGIISYDHEYPEETGVAEAKKIAGHVMASYRGGCPPAYIAQVSAYLTGLKLPFARIALLEDGVRLHVRTLEAGMDEIKYMQEKIETICPRFYQAVLDGKQVLAAAPKEQASSMLLEVIAEYSDILKVGSLSKDALDALAQEKRGVVLKGAEYDAILSTYAEAENSNKKAADKEAKAKNEIIELLIKNNAAAVEGTRYRAGYNKRFTFKTLQ